MAEKSVSPVHPRSLKAASSILKSLGSLGPRKSQLTNPRSGSQSPRSIHKSVSIVGGDTAAPKESEKISRIESKLSGKDLDSLNPSEDIERERIISIVDSKTGKTLGTKRRANKFMRKYPELFRDDVSINPSYTGLRNFPYNVVCRRRFHKNKSKINRQLNREIESITMMQTVALDGVRVGRIFTVGFHPKETIVQDFATPRERVRLNQLLCER